VTGKPEADFPVADRSEQKSLPAKALQIVSNALDVRDGRTMMVFFDTVKGDCG